MADANFTVQLVDRVTGPARSAARGVSRLEGSMGGLRRAAGGATGQMGAVTGASAGMKVGLLAVAAAGLYAAKAVVELAANIAGKLVGAVVGAAAKMDQMGFALSKFLGSRGAARSEITNLIKLSNKLGISFDDASESFKGFVSAGMTADAAREMVKFRADLYAVATSDKDIERLGEAFKQIEKAIATGRLEMDGFTSILAGLPGVTETSIFEKLAPMMGKTVDQLKKMDKTKLPVDKLLKAMKAAFLEATNASELGAAAMEKSLQTVGGAWDNLKNKAKNVFLEIGRRLLPVIEKHLLPIVKDLLKTLESPAAKKVIDGIVASFGALIKNAARTWKEMGGAKVVLGILEGIGDAIGWIAEAITGSGDAIKPFIDGIKSGFKAFEPALKGLKDAIAEISGTDPSKVNALTAAFKAFGYVIGATAGIIAGIVGGIVLVGAAFGRIASAVVAAQMAVTNFLVSIWNAITGAGAKVSQAASSLGSGIVQGIIAGITGGASGVVAAIVQVAKAAIGAGEGALKIKSPSKVFAQMGAQVAAGMEQGIAGGSPAVSAAAGRMINPSKMGGTTQNISAPARISMTVQGSEDPQQTAAVVAATLESKLAGMFESVALQVSVANG